MRWCVVCLISLCGFEAQPVLAQAADSGTWRVRTLSLPPLRPLTPAPNFVGVDFSPGEPDSLRGLSVDLNSDHQPDLLIRSESSLCGVSANCALAVIDGASHQVLAILEGAEVIVRPARPGNWPLLQVVAHLGAAEALLVSYAHDGQAYRATARQTVEGEGYLVLRRALDSIPVKADAP